MTNLSLPTIATVALMLTIGAGAIPANAMNIESTDPTQAIERSAPEVLVGAVDVRRDGDVFRAANEADNKTTITLPETTLEPVLLDSRAGNLSIGLPHPDAGAVAKVAGGVITFDNGDGSHTVPVAKNDGSVQITTVIDNARAPTRYSYPLGVPEGGVIAIVEGGQVLVTDGSGAPVGLIKAPWAKDANGTNVPTHYELDGNVLSQVVDIKTPGIVFPVVADPTAIVFPWGIGYKLTYSETQQLAGARDLVSAGAILCGLIGTPVGAVACGAAAIAAAGLWFGAIKSAADDGNCGQINVPWASGPALWWGYEVTC